MLSRKLPLSPGESCYPARKRKKESQKILIVLLFLFSLLSCKGWAREYIEAPLGWEQIQDPTQLPQKVRLIYIGKGKEKFTPSINLAVEETSLSLEDYVKQARQYHEQKKDTRCFYLGTLDTPAGQARVLQIDRQTQWGAIRFLQALVVIDKVAYVITTTCLREEFSLFSAHFIKAMRSFSIKSDIDVK